MAVIDFHSHVLPGIDDGSKSTNMSIRMLKMASAQGVDIMIATPHFYGSRARIEDFLEKRARAYDKLMRRKWEDSFPEIRLGAEVAFFPGISKAEHLEALAVEGSRILLVEMPFHTWPHEYVREVEELITMRNFRVILAHLERYMGMKDNRRLIEELLGMSLYVQINAESIIRWRGRRPLIKMFESGQADFLASDCHRTDRRAPNLGEGRAVLAKKLGADFLTEMDEKSSRLLQIGG
ncbi:MAG: capsular polysaccharide biosynthesis protein [Clostridiales bacterium]|nr:capsular polysaccharide biosynthesis protein [Clostridiales bacterium]